MFNNKTSWKIEDIRQHQKQIVEEYFSDKTKEQLLEILTDYRTAIYPINYTLSSNDWVSPPTSRYENRWFTSDLFLYSSTDCPEGQCSRLVQPEGSSPTDKSVWEHFEPDHSKPLPEGVQHIDSTVDTPNRFDDSIVVLAAYESAMAASIFNGEISFGDVRNLSEVLNNKYKD